MNSLAIEAGESRARSLSLTNDALTLELMDGRSITVPLVWFPRLWYGSTAEREHFEIFGDGTYIHWPDLDEDLTVEGLLAGRRSQESPQSLQRWLDVRNAGTQEAESTTESHLARAEEIDRTERIRSAADEIFEQRSNLLSELAKGVPPVPETRKAGPGSATDPSD